MYTQHIIYTLHNIVFRRTIIIIITYDTNDDIIIIIIMYCGALGNGIVYAHTISVC